MADESRYPTRIAPYGLRIPPDLKARIQAVADKNSRPMHTEILEALEIAFPTTNVADMSEHEIANFILSAESDEEREHRVELANKEHEARGYNSRFELGETPTGKRFRLITIYDFD